MHRLAAIPTSNEVLHMCITQSVGGIRRLVHITVTEVYSPMTMLLALREVRGVSNFLIKSVKAHLHLAVFLRDIVRRDTLPPAVAFTLGVKLAGNGERYANELTALSRCRHRQWHDNSKTKALIGQVHGWPAGSRRNIALEAIERGTARVSRRNK